MALLIGLIPLLLMGADDSLAERRQRVAALTAAQKEDLRRRWKDFSRLPSARQQQLRDLHHHLQQDPDADQLRRVMRRYCRWMKQLPVYQLERVLELKGDERIQEVRRLLAEQAKQAAEQLSAADNLALLQWLAQYLAQHDSRVREMLAEAGQPGQSGMKSPALRYEAMGVLRRYWQTDHDKVPVPSEKHLAELHARLGEAARKRLEKETPQEQWKLISGWAKDLLDKRIADRRFGNGPLPQAWEEPLARFFEEELPEPQRRRLLALPGNEMERELRRMFMERLRGSRGGMRTPHGGHSRTNRPGPPGAARPQGKSASRRPTPSPDAKEPAGANPPRP